MIQQGSVDPVLLRACARRQSMVSWTFSAIGTALFFGYLFLMTSDLPVMRASLPVTRSITVAFALGYLMVLLIVLLTGIFVIINNHYVRPLLSRLRP
jgi:FtsH-binding integral membrane protein